MFKFQRFSMEIKPIASSFTTVPISQQSKPDSPLESGSSNNNDDNPTTANKYPTYDSSSIDNIEQNRDRRESYRPNFNY